MFSKLLSWLQQQSPFWPAALGVLLGFGIGAGALFGIEGLAGAGLCMLVLGLVFFLAKDAEPVLVGVEIAFPRDKELLRMVEILGGTFFMGSLDSDNLAQDGEKLQHRVTVSDFFISCSPVNRETYRKIIESSPERLGSDRDDQRLPANNVDWFDAVKFCNALSERVGLQACYRIDGNQVEWDIEADGYRLPTEAEWEYACRVGTTSRWFFGDDPAKLGCYAWFRNNSDRKAHPVGKKKPNPLGLHDMIGNVWEWCWDWYGDYKADSGAKDMNRRLISFRIYYAIGDFILRIPLIGKLCKIFSGLSLHDPVGPNKGEYRVLRGGSAWSNAENLRSASRLWYPRWGRNFDIGFRCVRRLRRQH